MSGGNRQDARYGLVMMEAALYRPNIEQAINTAQTVFDSLQYDDSSWGVTGKVRASIVLSSAESHRLRPEAAETHARVAEAQGIHLGADLASRRLRMEARLRRIHSLLPRGSGAILLDSYCDAAAAIEEIPELVDVQLVALAKAIGISVAIGDRQRALRLIKAANDLRDDVENIDSLARLWLSKAYYLTTGFDPEGADELFDLIEVLPLRDNRIRICGRVARTAVFYLRGEVEAGDAWVDGCAAQAKQTGLWRTAVLGREIVERFRPQPRVSLS